MKLGLARTVKHGGRRIVIGSSFASTNLTEIEFMTLKAKKKRRNVLTMEKKPVRKQLTFKGYFTTFFPVIIKPIRTS